MSDKNIYQCDNQVDCGATFSREEIKLIPQAKNVTIWGAGDGDLLACPKCDRIHFFGFDLAENLL